MTVTCPGRMRFEKAVARFRAWADATFPAERHGGWECEYQEWPGLYETFTTLLPACSPASWDRSMTDSLLYALARDNDAEHLKEVLAQRPEYLLALARAGITSDEADARWQLADALGFLSGEADAVSCLEQYAVDGDEYVSRRALLALGRLHAPAAEALAERAWETGHEYQRIAALHVLSELGSALLPSCVERALADGRPFVIAAAERASRSPGGPYG